MARGGNLDVRTIDAAKPRASAYRLSDGGGLLLVVKPSGAKVWTLRVTVDGRRRDMGLGGYPGVSLREARDKAAAARRQAREGRDPIAERERVTREADVRRRSAAEAEARTFRSVALACIKAEAPGWKNEPHTRQKAWFSWPQPSLVISISSRASSFCIGREPCSRPCA